MFDLGCLGHVVDKQGKFLRREVNPTLYGAQKLNLKKGYVEVDGGRSRVRRKISSIGRILIICEGVFGWHDAVLRPHYQAMIVFQFKGSTPSPASCQMVHAMSAHDRPIRGLAFVDGTNYLAGLLNFKH
jgi:hypothetical protein